MNLKSTISAFEKAHDAGGLQRVKYLETFFSLINEPDALQHQQMLAHDGLFTAEGIDQVTNTGRPQPKQAIENLQAQRVRQRSSN